MTGPPPAPSRTLPPGPSLVTLNAPGPQVPESNRIISGYQYPARDQSVHSPKSPVEWRCTERETPHAERIRQEWPALSRSLTAWTTMISGKAGIASVHSSSQRMCGC